MLLKQILSDSVSLSGPSARVLFLKYHVDLEFLIVQTKLFYVLIKIKKAVLML